MRPRVHDSHMAVSGRYTHLSRPVVKEGNLAASGVAQPIHGSNFVVSVHSQTVLFLLVAILVGGGLLLIVPNLSASSGTETIPPADPQGDTQVAEQPAESELVVTIEVAAQADAAATGISPVFTSEVQYWAPKILEWSQLYGLDPDIIATIMQIESCGDPGAASHVGAQGLFQVMPFHFDPGEDMLDPDTNARRGMAFYNRQLEYTGHDIYLSFAGYNGGYAASGSSYPYWANETQRYYTWAKGIYDEVKSGMATSPTLEQWLAAGGSGGCQRAAQRIGL